LFYPCTYFFDGCIYVYFWNRDQASDKPLNGSYGWPSSVGRKKTFLQFWHHQGQEAKIKIHYTVDVNPKYLNPKSLNRTTILYIYSWRTKNEGSRKKPLCLTTNTHFGYTLLKMRRRKKNPLSFWDLRSNGLKKATINNNFS
jgi:hypothetical protein